MAKKLLHEKYYRKTEIFSNIFDSRLLIEIQKIIIMKTRNYFNVLY